MKRAVNGIMLLSKVKAAIEDDKNSWISSKLAVTNDGRPVLPDSEDAVAWNTVGRVLLHSELTASVAVLALYTATGANVPDPTRVTDKGYILQLVYDCAT